MTDEGGTRAKTKKDFTYEIERTHSFYEPDLKLTIYIIACWTIVDNRHFHQSPRGKGGHGIGLTLHQY